jgi:hypothetical protein
MFITYGGGLHHAWHVNWSPTVTLYNAAASSTLCCEHGVLLCLRFKLSLPVSELA